MAFRLVAPSSVDEAIRILTDPAVAPVAVLAGGTDLLLDLDAGRTAPATVLSLRRLPFREVRWDEESVEIGSTVALADLERDARFLRNLPGLATAVGAVGGYALRHRATLGGNLARAAPASDLLPVLLAHGATAELVGPRGGRTVPLAEFLRGSRATALGPGELVRSVRVPFAVSAYLWQRVRPANDISQVGVAVARGPQRDWRVAVGGVLPCARRLPSAEAELHGVAPEEAAIARAVERAREDAPFPTDKRASESYRRHLLGVLTGRAIRVVAAMGAP